MTGTLAPLVESFFTQRLIGQRHASPHTVASYRDTFRLLFCFAQHHVGKPPAKLDVADLDAVLIGRFLDHLESERGNSARTRNNRLAAIHSLFAYAALRHPEHAGLIQRVLAIPTKRTDRQLVAFLTDDEIEALLAAPDRTTWLGRRDHALLLAAIQTGLRVSELTGLCCRDIELRAGAHLACHGKRRKERVTPLTPETTAVLRVWMTERRGHLDDPLFPSIRGSRLSSDAVTAIVDRHVHTATTRCPTLATKTVSPHVLRHTCAMRLLAAGTDTSVIALWLGHESVETTQIYLHADLAIKERARARTAPTGTPPGRYRPPDTLLAYLESL